MLGTDQIRQHLKKLSYKDGWSFEVHETEWEGPFVRVLVDVENSYRPGEKTTLGINSFLPVLQDESELERWLMHRIIRVESHEAREFFKRDGEIIFDPHAEGEPFHM